MSDSVIAKYLERYAETVAVAASDLRVAPFDSAVVIPAYNETVHFVSRLLESQSDCRRLAIVVVNGRDNSPEVALRRNADLLLSAEAWGQVRELCGGVTFVERSKGVSLLLVDATSNSRRLQPKEGVGRARKMGLDLALALHASGHLRSEFCGSSDADAYLPRGYFDALERGEPGSCALLFPYRHRAADEERVTAAMMRVELGFRYYVLGLAHAQSPYAYHSLGSALAVSLPRYAQVRGVPNRQAGEDFYLLSKLSKLAPLRRLRVPLIEIETRLSDRVPFGTGPSLRRALDRSSQTTAYHPDSFAWLKEFLTAITTAASDAQGPRLSRHVPQWVVQQADKFYRDVEPHLAACPTAAHRVRRIHERFDALSTLQFIHRAHQEGLSHVAIFDAVLAAPFLDAPVERMNMLRYLAEKESGLPELVGLPPA